MAINRLVSISEDGSLPPAAKVTEQNLPARLTDSALSTNFISKGTSSSDEVIGSLPIQKVTGHKWFQAPVVFGNNTGLAASPRNPFQVNNVIDGSKLTNLTYGSDKVGSANIVTFKGGFTNDVTWGTSNPNFLWGANDFIITGDQAGDVAGIGDMWGRLSEVHLFTPQARLYNLFGFVGESNVNAVNAGVDNWMASIYAHAPRSVTHGTIAKAASLLVDSPLPGLATEQYAIYQEGPAKNVFQGGFGGLTPNNQSTTTGVYVGTNVNSPAIEFSDGTNNFRIDNTAGKFRVLLAGVKSLMEMDANGNTRVNGGFGVNSTAPVTKQTITGSRNGNAALDSLLNAMAAYGFITNNSTA